MEFKDRGRNIVLSRRMLLEEEARQHEGEVREQLEAGAIFEGEVTSLQPYGVFVDLGGGIEGLVHVSELSHTRVAHPKDMLTAGDKVRVEVLRYDQDRDRISLSMKTLESDPWDNVAERFPEGTVIPGTVRRLTDYGAFVEIAPGVEGLVYISELSFERVRHPSDVVQPEQEVSVKVIRLEPEKKRIGLSIKEASPGSMAQENEEVEEGALVEGTVEKVESFGLFLRLPGGNKGLIPNSEMGTSRDADHRRMFPKGSSLQVVIKAIDPQSGKIRLSRKDALSYEENSEYKDYVKKSSVKSDVSFGTLGDLLKQHLDK